MSVTIKLNDQDAKLLGRILSIVGNAAIEARSQPETQVPAHGEALNRADRARVFGNKTYQHLIQPYATPDELVRLAHAFDTAVYANEGGR